MTKYALCYILCLCLCLSLPADLSARKRAPQPPPAPQEVAADSLMSRVILCASTYGKSVAAYKSNLYIKGYINMPKRNFLLRFWPSIFRLRKGVDEYMMEAYGELRYTAPGQYDHKITAMTGTTSDFWQMDHRLHEFFHVNVYAPTLVRDKLLSPVAPNAPRYYQYRLDSVWGPAHERTYKIRFQPRNKSFQLVDGYLVVTDNVWSIRRMAFSGRSEWFAFDVSLEMGDVGSQDEFLPLRCVVDGRFALLGNRIEGRYTAKLDYHEITHRGTFPAPVAPRRDPYDLTDYYTLRCDTNAYVRDTATFKALRPEPLLPRERQVYADFFASRDTVGQRRRNKHQAFWGQVGDVLLRDYTVDIAHVGSVNCSPLINPLLLSYSGSNGLSYRQQFKYNRLFSGDRLLRVVPQIGYNFTRKEFYWSMGADFDYLPRQRAALHLEIGNGNRIYSSDVLEDLKAIPDSVFDFNQIHLDYFKDFYVRLRHTWEIVNGLTLDVGLSIHRRTEAEPSRFEYIYPQTPPVRSVTDDAAASPATPVLPLS